MWCCTKLSPFKVVTPIDVSKLRINIVRDEVFEPESDPETQISKAVLTAMARVIEDDAVAKADANGPSSGVANSAKPTETKEPIDFHGLVLN